jgi:hypothetical protein
MKLPIKSINEFTECSLSINEILEVISTKIGEVEGVSDLSKMY